jgi:hypothetical protein
VTSSTHTSIVVLGVLVAGAIFLGGLFLPIPPDYYQAEVIGQVDQTVTEETPKVVHLPTPEPLKAVYMSQCIVGTPTLRSKLVSFIEETEINAIVIDIKDYTGRIAFNTENPIIKDSVSNKCMAPDMKTFIEELHKKDIYVIGRITVFQDPYYTSKHPEQAVQSKSTGSPWKDFKGLSFIDVSSESYWEYVVALSKESYEIGFDELNYDYIRYPSDGKMDDAVYINPARAEAVEVFWKYLHDAVKPTGAVMSADLFGMTTVNHDDLGIGQVLERALPYFDYIAPMVYPSHYPKSYLGLSNPNKDPYRVVNHSMVEAVTRTVATSTRAATLDGELIASTSPQLYTKESYSSLKLRPWLQDFDYGGDYGAVEVRAQIDATYDAGLTSWMLWSPSNVYTKEALEPFWNSTTTAVSN